MIPVTHFLAMVGTSIIGGGGIGPWRRRRRSYGVRQRRMILFGFVQQTLHRRATKVFGPEFLDEDEWFPGRRFPECVQVRHRGKIDAFFPERGAERNREEPGLC